MTLMALSIKCTAAGMDGRPDRISKSKAAAPM